MESENSVVDNASTVLKKLANNTYKTKSQLSKNKKSKVWDVCHLIVDSEKEEEIGYVQCMKCKSLLTYRSASKSGTSHLLRHKCNKMTVASNAITSFLKSHQTENTMSGIKHELISKCVNFCTKDIRPFDSVSGEGFKELVQHLISLGSKYGNLNVEELLPHPTTVSRHAVEIAKNKRDLLTEIIEKHIEKHKIAATTDMWTDDFKKISYTTFTIHFIDEKWQLKKHVLFTCDFPDERKAGDNIKRELERRFISCGLNSQLFNKIQFVTDQGANIIKALENNERMNCAAHVINTVLRHTFDSKQLNGCHANISRTIQGCKELVRFMKQSGNLKLLPKTLIQEVETRWNSMFEMLKSVDLQFDEIINVLYENDNEDMMNNIERDFLKILINFLAPFKEASEELEADNSPTVHKVLLWYKKLINHCTVNENSQSSEEEIFLKSRAKKFLVMKFEINTIHKVATFLWPRFRQLRMLTEVERQQVAEYIQNKLLEFENMAASTSNTDVVEIERPNKLSKFDQWEDTSCKNSDNSCTELDKYMQFNYDYDDNKILQWWAEHENIYPGLSSLVKDTFCIPATSASSERNFSTAGRILEERRTRLNPTTVDALLFLHDY